MGKGRKSNLIIKTWERCKSIGRSRNNGGVPALYKSKSWPTIDVSLGADQEKRRTRRSRVTPEGCFTVYVGPQKQRFVIKTEYANHPLFKILLEEAESEYGFHSEGPLVLPCDVDLFCRVLLAMDDGDNMVRQGCRFAKRYGSYQLLSPPRMMTINHI
ncbi:putative Atrazine chlorohydrolase [Hibiscus syriacus]|uniref:Atrazine chlorohydrolase n=1 Tax=Hibiscus syriacus TaxID=106335 RepID=A0A6A2WSR4_HIBSY|nr:auxin-responsive protein SAUR32-like [Hibiscus syriacus]KAE8663928.1 putative Atrazine chlorohydrolase [Hibiscus syriacus]